MVRVYSRDVGEVRDVYRKECGFVWQLEDGIEEWIKRDMGRLWI